MSLKNKDILNEGDEAIKDLANQIYQAFSTIGFVYLKNHGIPQEVINSGFEVYDKFFCLSPDIKKKYGKKDGNTPNGWDELERESTNPERPGDLKESFDVGAVDDENFNWPNAEVPDFQSTVSSIYKHLADLGLKVLSLMAIGLHLKPDAFAYAYEKRGTLLGGTQLRCNYYPMITDISKVKPGQIRCGEHTDYGGIALLIQDNAGGLEVSHVNGEFVAATPIDGTVVVNIGDLMQRWTSDKLKSTVHRVLIPEDEVKRCSPRRSLAFFVDPDVSALITCMDGSNKYPPITSGEWMQYRLRETYKY